MRGRNHRHHPHGPHDRQRQGFGPPWGRGFGDFPPGWGPRRGHGPGGRGRHGHGGRSRRGDIRAAILLLLAEQARHGYEIISEIGERSNGLWRPSPGSIYPTLQLLADEGLIQSDKDEGKRLFELTEEGRKAVEALDETPPWEQIAQDADPDEMNLREATGTLLAAVGQVAAAGTRGQKAKAVKVLGDARRSIYSILGEDEPDEDQES